MRGRLFFWFIVVSFCLLVLPKHWPLVLIVVGGILVSAVVMLFRDPGGAAQSRG